MARAVKTIGKGGRLDGRPGTAAPTGAGDASAAPAGFEAATAAPQFLQNLLPSLASVPQFAQYILAPSLLPTICPAISHMK
jgi:hypothetical protein